MGLWVFDNDGTLYNANLAEVEFMKHLVRYLVLHLGIRDEEEGSFFAKQMRLKHNTTSTVIALMQEFDLDIKRMIEDTYLCVDLDLCQVPREDPERDKALVQIKGRKVVLTNNPSAFAKKILDRVGLAVHFDDIIGMEETGLVLKPDPEAFVAVMRRHPDAARIFLCDDSLENLDAAMALGWKTVWYQPDKNIHQGDSVHSIVRSFEELARIATLM